MTASLDQEQIERGKKVRFAQLVVQGPLEPKERSRSERNGRVGERKCPEKQSTDTPTDCRGLGMCVRAYTLTPLWTSASPPDTFLR